MEAHGRFDIEMQQLEALHAATLFAYDEAVERTKERVHQKYLDPEKPIERQLATANTYTIASNVESLRKKYKKDFREHLRETLFIRAISILEVFLVDTVMDIFLARKDLFHRDEMESLSYRRLLSFKSLSEISTHLINKECRNLHKEGFEKVKRYFSKHFDVSFGNCAVPLSRIKEYHDRRHLLVHRLGRTDLKYRKLYDTSDRKVKVEQAYLLQVFEDIRCFHKFIHSEALILINKLPRKTTRSSEIATKATAIASPLSRLGKRALLLANHSFACDDDVLTLSDILKDTKKSDSGSIVLMLQGNSRHLQAYMEHLRALEREDYLEVEEFTISRPKPTKKNKTIPKEIEKKIIKSMPPKPWAIGIHKEIAVNFGITNGQAYRVLWKLKQKDACPPTTEGKY